MIRFLLLLVLVYFALRAARNLWRAVAKDGRPPADRLGDRRGQEREPGRSVWDREIEEARYRDL